MKTPTKEKIEPRWLDVKQAGVYMCKSPGAVRKKLSRGQLPYVQDGRRILIDRLDIDRMLEQRKTEAA